MLTTGAHAHTKGKPSTETPLHVLSKSAAAAATNYHTSQK